MGWYEAIMHIFTVTTTSDRESWAGNDDEVSAFNLTVFQIFYWTVGKVWKLIPLKEGGLKVHTLKMKKISAARSAAKLLHIFSHRASRGAAVPLHFKFASYAYAGMYNFVQLPGNQRFILPPSYQYTLA